MEWNVLQQRSRSIHIHPGPYVMLWEEISWPSFHIFSTYLKEKQTTASTTPAFNASREKQHLLVVCVFVGHEKGPTDRASVFVGPIRRENRIVQVDVLNILEGRKVQGTIEALKNITTGSWTTGNVTSSYNGVIKGQDDHLRDGGDIANDRRCGASGTAEAVRQHAAGSVTDRHQIGVFVERANHFIAVVSTVVVSITKLSLVDTLTAVTSQLTGWTNGLRCIESRSRTGRFYKYIHHNDALLLP